MRLALPASSGFTIATGIAISRLTGFVRGIVLVAAVGATTEVGNAFAVANQLPNNIYALISTGLLSAVVVPQIVRAMRDPDGGDAYISKLFTIAVSALMLTALTTTLLAPALVSMYAPGFDRGQYQIACLLAYICMPQIVFYGVFSILGEYLNARGMYGPYAWAPIVNNMVSILGFGTLFFALRQREWDTGTLAALGAVTTFGTVAQAAVLFIFVRRARVKIRPDFRWRGHGFLNAGRLAGWTLVMVLGAQMAGLVQSQVLSSIPTGSAGLLVAQNSWLLFMLPYSLIVMSLGTPLFTSLSTDFADDNHARMRNRVAKAARHMSILTILGSVILACAASPASRLFTATPEEATAAAHVLLSYIPSLVPLGVLFVFQRTFFAMGDTRTPALIALVQCVLVALAAVGASTFASDDSLTATVAAGQSAATIAQTIAVVFFARRRLRGVLAREWVPSTARSLASAVPAAAAGIGIYGACGGQGGWIMQSPLAALIGILLIATSCAAVFTLFCLAFRSVEAKEAIIWVTRRLQKPEKG